MSLSAYKQIRFPTFQGTTGNFKLIINRPGFSALTQPATDTLLLSENTPGASTNEDYIPFLESDFTLSKKFTTTKGRRAMDDLSIVIRDAIAYTGVVNGTHVHENFLSIFQTFFDVWFNDVLPYKAFIQYTDALTGNTEISHEGWIDPTYKPSTDVNVISAGTSEQIWVGSRTIKITSFSQAQLSLTWRDALATIGPSDCKAGLCYNGFMFAPPLCEGKINTRGTAFSSAVGAWYQAVPHIHLYDANANPILVASGGIGAYSIDLRVQSWPSVPFQLTPDVTGIGDYSYSTLPGSYVAGDTGTVNGGSIVAHYTIVDLGGGDLFVELISTGSGYSVGSHATTATSGVGTGLIINVNSLSASSKWGPSGLVFIKLGTLFEKIATVLGFDPFTPSTDLKSALGFWSQITSTAGGQQCFPIDTSAAIPVDELYVSFNVLAKSHPADGSYWDNPAGYSPDTPLSDVLTGLCNALLADFNESYATTGEEKLILNPMGDTSSSLPNWEVIGTPSQEEAATGPRVVIVNNRGDDFKIQSPIGIVGDSSSIEIPIRVHRFGQTSGVNPVNDKECITWDSSVPYTSQADECFKVAWVDPTGVLVINPNCWKGLCYFYQFSASSSNAIYPSVWSPFDGGSWANSFFVVNAIFKAGDTPPANLLARLNGNDYFNTRCYPAVAFAALTLALPTMQSFEYRGITNSSGSIQAIGAGMAGVWRNGPNASQNWRAVEVTQTLFQGITSSKFQAYGTSGAFPELSDLSYGPVGGSGGTSSTTGGNTLSGGTQPPPSSTSWHPRTIFTVTGAGVVALTGYDSAYLCTDATTTGVTVPTVTAPYVIVVTNKTGGDFVTGNLFLANNATWVLYYDGTVSQSDPTLPAGWNLMGRSQ